MSMNHGSTSLSIYIPNMPQPDGSMEGLNSRTFGAGLKRKRIEFVPPEPPSWSSRLEKPPNHSLGDLYLSITLKENDTPLENPTGSVGTPDDSDKLEAETGNRLKEGDICEICKLHIQSNRKEKATASSSHELSLAHQVCAEHSYPPSHLDRGRQGLKYLSFYGWDPDSRLGLGASGRGIRVPIKAKMKHDTAGLGVELPEGKLKMEKTVEKLGAKEVRKLEMKNKKQREKLQQKFYGNDDIEKYLGAG